MTFIAGYPETQGLVAFAYGTLSGISLPIGTALGVWLAPVNEKVCGGILAFGGGALIFAVTVAIYGKALTEYKEHEMERYECWDTILGGVAGAIFYLYVARWLESGEDHHGGHHAGDAEKALPPVDETVPFAKEAPTARSGKELWSVAAKRRSIFLPDEVAHKSKRRVSSLSKSASLADAVLKTTLVTHDAEEQEKKHAMEVALSLFAGLLIDGVPEGVFMGFLAAEKKLSMALVLSLIIANFPEAFSSASMLQKAGMGFWKIMAMWGGLCVLVGALCGLSCWALLHIFPAYATGAGLPKAGAMSVSLIEGFTGGAMLSCIASVMLPEAQETVGKGGPLLTSAGFLTTLGFLTSVALEVTFPSV